MHHYLVPQKAELDKMLAVEREANLANQRGKEEATLAVSQLQAQASADSSASLTALLAANQVCESYFMNTPLVFNFLVYMRL